MTNGMKSGASSDPFADDATNEEEPPDESEASTGETDGTTDSSPTSNADTDSSSDETSQSGPKLSAEELPYIFDRDGVKDDRKITQYFLREETQNSEKDVRRAVENELGLEIPLTDVREALVRVGANHSDEVADELRDWGYRLREE